MIPYSILACDLPLQDGRSLPVRILDLSSEGFTFRLPRKLIPHPFMPLQVHFYFFSRDAFQTVPSSSHAFRVEEETDFYTVYRFSSEDPDFLSVLEAFLKEYIALVRLKAEQEPARVTQKLTGYPAEQEDIFSPSYSAWQKKQLDLTAEKTDLSGCGKVLALCADRPSLYQSYLSSHAEAFRELCFSASRLKDHSLMTLPFKILYIGNSFCSHLLPAPSLLGQLWQKAAQEGLTPVLQLPPLKEASESLFLDLFKVLSQVDPKAEIILNDLGALTLLPQGHRFRLTGGLFLNRSRRDPRFPFRNGYAAHRDLYGMTLSDPLLLALTRKGVSRLETEDASMPQSLPGSLHLPYVRLNTGGFCPLHAAVHNHNPALQEEVTACGHDCETRHFLYPDFLKTIGTFNSVFQLDDTFLKKPGLLKDLSRIDRIVLEMR